jgi:glycosyl transferase family 25
MPAIDWPLYVINLDRAVERRDAITERMNRVGLSFERFPAVDARDLTAERIGEVVAADQIRHFKRALSRPEIACYLSHIAVWRAIAAGDKPAAFVFEDDVDFVDDAPIILKSISGRPPDWDVLRLYTDRPIKLVDGASLINGYRCGVPRPQPKSCVAYAITRAAAGQLAALALPITLPVDMYFRHWWRIKACLKIVQPSGFFPAESNLSTSEIAPSRWDHRGDPYFVRFYRNIRYHFGYGLMELVNRRRVPRSPSWPQAS